jgi:hypothetical protein
MCRIVSFVGSTAFRLWLWAKGRIMSLHPLVANFGWVGLLTGGLGAERASEYLLGLMLLCASSASLALVSIRVPSKLARAVIVSASILMLVYAFKWTFVAKGSDPWSQLLPRHDFTVTTYVVFEIPRSDTAAVLTFAKRDKDDNRVIPVTVAIFLRIANARSIPERITNLDISLIDLQGKQVNLSEVPSNCLYFHSHGEREEFVQPFLRDILETSPIGPRDSASGIALFETDSDLKNPPYHWDVILRDLSGNTEQAKVVQDSQTENLEPGYITIKIMDKQYWDDPKTWKIAKFREVQ